MKQLLTLLVGIVLLTSCEKITTGTLISVQVYSPSEVYIEVDSEWSGTIPAHAIEKFTLRDDRVMYITSQEDTYIHVNAEIVELKANVRTIHYPVVGELNLEL